MNKRGEKPASLSDTLADNDNRSKDLLEGESITRFDKSKKKKKKNNRNQQQRRKQAQAKNNKEDKNG